MDDEEYVTAVRLRLGCGGPIEPAVCSNCGCSAVTSNGTHALLCARGESTKGHNAIRDELHNMASTIDPSSEIEPPGLIGSAPLLRPADLLSGAFTQGRLAAVDVGIICPSAAGSGADCVVTMEARKLARMDPYKDELAAAAIDYRPFAISCWGRLHPNARQMLISLAKRIARRVHV